MTIYGYGAAIAALGLCATPALAQEQVAAAAAQQEEGGVSGFFAIGPGATPKYDGAKGYDIIPFAVMDLNWKNIEFELRGLRARADVLGDSRWQAGPVANLRFKRDSMASTRVEITDQPTRLIVQ